MTSWILVIEVCFCLVAVLMVALMLLCYVRRRMRGEMGPHAITQKYKHISKPLQRKAAIVTKTNEFDTLISMDGTNQEAKELLSSENTRVSTELSEIITSSEDAFMITKNELPLEQPTPSLPPAAPPVLYVDPPQQNLYENIEQLKRGFASFACSKNFQLSNSTNSSNLDYSNNEHVINDSFDTHVLGGPFEKRSNTHAVRFSRLKDPQVIYENSIMEKKNAYNNSMRSSRLQSEQGLMNKNCVQGFTGKNGVQGRISKTGNQVLINSLKNTIPKVSSTQNLQTTNGSKPSKTFSTCSQWVEKHAFETKTKSAAQTRSKRNGFKEEPPRKPEEPIVNMDDGSIDQLYQNTRRKKVSVDVKARNSPQRRENVPLNGTAVNRADKMVYDNGGGSRYNCHDGEELCLMPGTTNCYPNVNEARLYYPPPNLPHILPPSMPNGQYNDQEELNTFIQFEEPFEEDILFDHKGFGAMDNNGNSFGLNGVESYDIENRDFISPRNKPSVRFSDLVNEETYEATDFSESYNDDPFMSTDDDDNGYNNGNSYRHNKTYRRPSETYRQNTYGYSGLPDLFDIKEEEEDNTGVCMINNARSQQQDWVTTKGCYKDAMQNSSNWVGKIPFEKLGMSLMNQNGGGDPYELKEVNHDYPNDPESDYNLPCDVKNMGNGSSNNGHRHFSRKKGKKPFRKISTWRNSDLYESDISTRSHRDSYESSEGQFADAEDNVEYSRVRRKHSKYNHVDEDSGVYSIGTKKKSKYSDRSRKHYQLQNYQNVQQAARIQPIGRDHLNMEGRSMFR